MKYYEKYIDYFLNSNGERDIKSFKIVLKNIKLLNLITSINRSSEVDKFFNLLDFFNYRYSTYDERNGKYLLYIEPIYSQDVSEYFNKCHRQAYHFTLKENAKKY